MPKVGRARQFEKDLRDRQERPRTSTARGLYAFEDGNTNSIFRQAQALLKPGISLPYERPTRNYAEAYLVQEMMSVSSRLTRGLWRLAGDATQDETGASQPFTVVVDESNPQLREKLFLEIQEILKRTKLGYKGPARVFRMLWSGDAIGELVFNEYSFGWQLDDVIILPTYELHYDKRKDTWKQIKEGTFDQKAVAEWGPGELVRASHALDDQHLYGCSALTSLFVNYRQYIAALEDLYVAARTRAPARLAFLLGDEQGTWQVDKKTLREFKQRNELGMQTTVVSNLYLSRGFEEVKEISGDAQGVKALLEVVHAKETTMLEDLGLPANLTDMAGRHVSESADASYASTINTLRGEDNQFVVDVVKRGLLVRGYKDVDIDISIPPLGEAASVRDKRVWDAYHAGDIDFFTACAMNGLKNPFHIRKRLEEDMAWIKKNPDYLEYYARGQKPAVQSGVSGSEASNKGGNSKQGEQRRKSQKQAGKKTPSGV